MARLPYTIPLVPAPEWANEEKTRVNISVVFLHLGTEPVRYTAAASDPGWEHSEEIFTRAEAGDFGPVAPYLPPPSPPGQP